MSLTQHGELMSAWLSIAALSLTTAAASPSHSHCEQCDEEFPEESEPLQWSEEGFYWMLGTSPGATFHLDGFNPVIRYSTELGMEWTYGKTRLTIGSEGHILQYLEAKRVGGGLHGVVTFARGPAYIRSGLGVVAGVPGSPNDRDTRPGLSGLLGVGLESREDDVRGRLGFDYNLSVDKSGRVNNTFFVVLQLRFG